MTQEQKDEYNELEATAAALREEVEQARTQIDHLNREKEEFSKEISGSQVIFTNSIISDLLLNNSIQVYVTIK